MIEVYNNKEKLIGFIDGTEYLNKKKKVIGPLKKSIYKDKSGTILLILKNNGDITRSEDEKQGYIKESKIFSSYTGSFVYKFKKDKGKIINSAEDSVLYLKDDIDKLED